MEDIKLKTENSLYEV